ncbi:UNVERIFIED_CONTAM: hypothetical protein GTU68_065922 [Idotea baltica]|nr:hypothetical protein [Idotea baltica]
MFPGGVHSPVRAFKSVEGAPLFIDRGQGSYLYDVDGNRFLDFCCSWGPLLLGHNNDEIREAITATLHKGTSFGAPSKLGNQLGRWILDHHRYIDKIRFVSSGTEAVTSAVRLARGYSGKTKIVKFEGCYHGHVDSLLVKAGSGLATFGVSTSAGIPDCVVKDTIVLPLADLKAVETTLEDHHQNIACVIIEPIPANNGLLIQSKSYLTGLRELCTKYGVLLIFDEVISGFRVGFEGAAGLFDIQPDIITFGKIIGGGMPVGAYGGSHEIMGHVAPDGDVYQAGTLSANPIAMQAGFTALQIAIRDDIYTSLAAKTTVFVTKINDLLASRNLNVSVQTIGSIFWLAFSKETINRADQIAPISNAYFKHMYRYLLNHGIYLGPSAYEVGFISVAHTPEQLDQAARTIVDALAYAISYNPDV